MNEFLGGPPPGRVDVAELVRIANDALTEAILARVGNRGGGSDLLEGVDRAGLRRALPALAELVENGDLDRLVRLARVYASAEDALSDDIVARLAELAGDGLALLDRINRSGIVGLLERIEALQASGDIDRMLGLLDRLADCLPQVEGLLAAIDRAAVATTAGRRAKGGVMGLLGLITSAENQEAIRYLINVGKALEKQAVHQAGADGARRSAGSGAPFRQDRSDARP